MFGFVSKKELKRDVDYMALEMKELRDKYLELWHKHERLMHHLGLEEHKYSGIELRSKGGPEQG